MEVNVKAAMFLSKHFVEYLQYRRTTEEMKKDEPRIVLVSSVLGVRPFNGLGAYCVSKTALHGLARVLAGEL